jgi:hypothetical protein
MLKWNDIRGLTDTAAAAFTPAQIERQEFEMEHCWVEQAHSDARRQAALRRDAQRSRRQAVED